MNFKTTFLALSLFACTSHASEIVVRTYNPTIDEEMVKTFFETVVQDAAKKRVLNELQNQNLDEEQAHELAQLLDIIENNPSEFWTDGPMIPFFATVAPNGQPVTSLLLIKNDHIQAASFHYEANEDTIGFFIYCNAIPDDCYKPFLNYVAKLMKECPQKEIPIMNFFNPEDEMLTHHILTNGFKKSARDNCFPMYELDIPQQ